MKAIITYFVFVFSSFIISAQDQPATDTGPKVKLKRWEIVLSSNAKFVHSDGDKARQGRSALQVGYHLNRVLIVGAESSLAANGRSVFAQGYVKFRKGINDDFFWFIQGDAGYEWSTFTRAQYEFIDGEFVVVSEWEGRRDRFRSDVTIGFEYLIKKQWGILTNLNFMEGVGVGIRHNF